MTESRHTCDHGADADLTRDAEGNVAPRRARTRRMLGRLVPGGAIMVAALAVPEFSVGAGDRARGERSPDPLEPAVAKANRVRTAGAASTAQVDAARLAGVRYAPILDLGNRPERAAALKPALPRTPPAASPPVRARPERQSEPLSASAPQPGSEAADLVTAPTSAAPGLGPTAAASTPADAPVAKAAAAIPPAPGSDQKPAARLDPASLSNVTFTLDLGAPRPGPAVSSPLPGVTPAPALVTSPQTGAAALAAPGAGAPPPPLAVPPSAPSAPEVGRPAAAPDQASLANLSSAPGLGASRAATVALPSAPATPPAPAAIEPRALAPAARSIEAPTPGKASASAAAGLAPAPAATSAPTIKPPPATLAARASAAPAGASGQPGRSVPTPAPAPPPAAAGFAAPKPSLAAPAASAPARIADVAPASQLLTRVDGRAAGMLEFQQTPEGLKVRLGGVAEVLADRYDAATLARIRSSPASQVWVTLAELQAKGVPISYDPIYDEFNIGQTDTRPRDARKVHIDQIGAAERGPGAAALPQVRP